MTSDTPPAAPDSAQPSIFWGHMWIPNLTVFIGGMCIMVAELVAGRLISRYLGQSLYTWTSCIGVFLTGISIGNYLGGRLADAGRPRPTLAVLFLIAAAACLTIPLVNRLANDWPFLWERSWPVRIFIHVTLTFIFPAVMLGTLGPVAAKMALTEVPMKTGRIIGQVYAWGAVGSIVGTYLTGFYLVAAMGSVAVIATVAAILAAMGLAFAAASWSVRGSAAVIFLASLSCFLSAGPFAALGSVLALREKEDPEVLLRDESQYSYIQVKSVDQDLNRRVMYLDRLAHSVGDMAHPEKLLYEYSWVYEAIMETFSPGSVPVRVFLVGGGGFSVPKYIEKTRPGSHVETAEIDPAVTEAAFRAFGLNRDTRMVIHNKDAREVTTQLTRQIDEGRPFAGYDYFLGDSINDYTVPYHLTTKEFAQQVFRLLKDTGIYMLNFIDAPESAELAGAMLRTCEEVFPFARLIIVNGWQAPRSTFVLVCAKQPLDLSGIPEAIAGRHPFQGEVVGPDQAERLRSRGMVLTDDHAPVENLLAGLAMRDKDYAVQRYGDAGVMLARAGKLEDAAAYFEKALAHDPYSAKSLFNLYLIAVERGRMEEAYLRLQQALRCDPYMWEARRALAQIHADAGQLPEAVQNWSVVARYNPDDAGTLGNLGTAYLLMGRPEEAWQFVEKSLAMNPRDLTALNSAGILWDRRGDLARALDYYLKALEVNSAAPETHYNAGLILLRQGRPEAAREHFEAALRLNPDFTAARQQVEAMAAAAPSS